MLLSNPILPGFNPDPSIVGVNGDYYIANSTFEWYPGVQIHHSKNLKDWSLISRPLSRAAQLDMRGNPDSCGVWAPCLSYADGQFWLVYSDVKRFGSNLMDVKNYIVTSKDICGPWSDPVFVNSSGFDPSLFHDTDGKKYFLNMQWDHWHAENRFKGILLQEYSAQQNNLIGEAKLIFTGTDLGLTEAPHLYKRGEWYYLITAAGGTSMNHAMTMARSKSIDGEYELHPDTYLVTTKDARDSYLQKCGHGDYVEINEREAYVVFLCGRPVTSNKRCVLGRETAIQKALWGDDGWLYLENGSNIPSTTVTVLDVNNEVVAQEDARYEYKFDVPELPRDFQWLRTPESARLFSLTERPGFLRLYGRETIGSWFEQSLVARRQVNFNYAAITSIEFFPVTFQQYAGLVCYYNRTKFHYLTVTHNEKLGRVLRVMSCLGDYFGEEIIYSADMEIPDIGALRLRAEVQNDSLKFLYSFTQDDWENIGGVLDMSVLSDEGGRGEHASFTGAFIGMACSDLTGGGKPADFSDFAYYGE